MEPYRPFVDLTVVEMKSELEEETLSKENKAELLKLLAFDVIINNKKRPMMIALTETTASLARCFAGSSNKIVYPELVK